MYKSARLKVPGPGRVGLVYTPASSDRPTAVLVHDFQSPGVVRGVHNLDRSIRSFAQACIHYAVSEKMDIWFGAKDTISKTYHGTFKRLFGEEVEAGKADLEKAGITYRYMLIDDAVAQAMRHPGGFLWACM